MQLDRTQLTNYLNLIIVNDLKKTLKEGQEVISCPFCQYFEIRDKDSTNFFWCKAEKCKLMSCTVCKMKLEGIDDKVDEETSEDELVFKHFMCMKLKPDKEAFEEGIRQGQGTACPKCKRVGTKDENCTHIVCTDCHLSYCYVCGLSEATCDKEERKSEGERIHLHNIDWMNNKRRCPMYLIEFAQLDNDFEETDEIASLVTFHRKKTIYHLRKLFLQDGSFKWMELIKQFPSIGKHGYTYTEIRDTDINLIASKLEVPKI